MTKQSGLGDQLLIDGYLLSGDIGSLSRIGGGPAPLEMTGIDKSAFERLGGTLSGAIEFTSWVHDAAGQAHPVLSALPTADRYVTYLRGSGVGNGAASLLAVQIGYDPTRNQDGALTLNTSAQSTGGLPLEWGEQLTAGVRTDTAATNGTGLDGGASSTFGASAYLQVRSVTGTSVTVTLQDSADNSSWANITGGAFTAATTRGAQRLSISGTIRRYVRAITTGTFTNAQFAVVFTRHLTAVSY